MDDRVEDVAKAYKQADKWVDDRVDDMEYWIADAKEDTKKDVNNPSSFLNETQFTGAIADSNTGLYYMNADKLYFYKKNCTMQILCNIID